MTNSHEHASQLIRQTTRLILICQAEGVHLRFGELAAQFTPDDTGLTAAGWAQADSVAAWLQSHVKVDAVISGSQLPSRLTAQRIALILKLPPRIQHNVPSARVTPPTLPANTASVTSLPQLPVAHPDPNSDITEEAQSFARDVVAALNDIVAENWGRTIVVVTHESAIAAMVGQLTGMSHVQIQIDNTSLTEISWQEMGWRIVYINKREHFPWPALPVSPNAVRPTVIGEPLDHLALVRRIFNRAAATYAQSKWTYDAPRIEHFLRFADLPKNLDVLDVGVGPGILPVVLLEHGAASALGIDISEGMLEQAEYARLSRAPVENATRIGYRLAPVHNLPFPEGRFDLICCRLVLQHLHNPEAAIQEMVRVLKPGGHLILAELLSVDDPVKRATQNAIEERRDPSHVSARSADQYRGMVVNWGLTIEKFEVALFERDLEEWLDTLSAQPDDRSAVTEMIEAGLETDAAGINARYRGGRLVFDQRMLYLKAAKG